MQSEIENLPGWVQENIRKYWDKDYSEAWAFLYGMIMASTHTNSLFYELLFLQEILTAKLRIHHNLPDRVEA